MKFALVNGQRLEAQPNLSGNCPACDHPMIAKCGNHRVRHWAHQRNHLCDPWWENEGEWHRAWKAEFPDAWHEIVCRDESGAKHIADVKTEYGWVIELQHSRISPEERRSRDAFYRQLVWVVDGTSRKRDVKQFANAWNDGTQVGRAWPVRRLYVDDCAMLREWTDSQTPIFIDFGGGQWLWWVLSGRLNGAVYVAQFPRAVFIHIHRGGIVQEGLDFAGLIDELSGLISRYEADIRFRP